MAFGRRKVGKRRLAAALVAGGLLGSLLAVGNGGPVQAAQSAPATFPGDAAFSGHASGVNVYADALTVGAAPEDDPTAPAGPAIAQAGISFSGAATNSQTFTSRVTNEMNEVVVPANGDPAEVGVDSAGKEGYGKGTGLDLGVAQDLPSDGDGQLALGGVAHAASAPPERSDADADPPGTPPNGAETGLVLEELATVPVSALAYVEAIQGRAAAVWNDKTCILGQPIAYGEGKAARAQLVDSGETNEETGEHQAPVVETSEDFFGTENRSASHNWSFTYLKHVGGGVYGLVSETHMTFAPISILPQTPVEAPSPIVIEILGEWVMRATATGTPGGATVDYDVVGPFDPEDGDDPDDPTVIRIWLSGEVDTPPQIAIKRSELFTAEGIQIGIPPESDPPAGPAIAALTIGEDERALQPAAGTQPNAAAPPTLAADGTLAAGAADVIRLALLDLDLGLEGEQLAELRIGHTEARAQVPPGGIKCQFPVRKDGPTTVTSGERFTWTISIPSDSEALRGLNCDLTSIRAVDTVRTVEGSVRAVMSNPSNGGVVSDGGSTVTWENLGPYKIGDPPIQVTVDAVLTGVGRVENLVDVTATLGNCRAQGQLTGAAIDSDALLQGAGIIEGGGQISGGATVQGVGTSGPIQVNAAQVLPATGASSDTPMYAGLAIAALLTAAGVYRLNRKAVPTSS